MSPTIAVQVQGDVPSSLIRRAEPEDIETVLVTESHADGGDRNGSFDDDETEVEEEDDEYDSDADSDVEGTPPTQMVQTMVSTQPLESVDDNDSKGSEEAHDDANSISHATSSLEDDDSDAVVADVIDDSVNDIDDENMVTATSIDALDGHSAAVDKEHAVPSSIVLSPTGIQNNKKVTTQHILSSLENKIAKEQNQGSNKRSAKQHQSNQNVRRGKWTLGPRIGKGAFGSVHTCMTDSGSVVCA